MNLSSLTIANDEANLELLNKACTKFASINGDDPEYQNINDALIKFRERPDSFNFCFPIINGEYHTYTKFLAYQIVKNTIMDKWNTFTDDDKENIRSSILISIVKMVKEGQKYSTISMAIQSLIEVLKFDWPEKWASFINELTATCQNEGIQFLKTGLDILKMLAEEVSSNLASDDFSLSRLTKDRQRSMQAGIIKEFQIIYSLIESAFNLKESGDQFDSADIMEIDTKALDAFNSFIPIIGSEQLLESPFLSNIAPLISDDRFVFKVFSIFGRLCEHIAKTDTDHSVAKQLEKNLFPVFQMSIQQIYTNYGDNINFNCVEYNDIQVLIQCVYEFLNLFIPVLNLADYQTEILVAVGWIIQTSNSGFTSNKDDLVFSEVVRFWHFFSTMLLQSASNEESQFQEIFSSSLSQVVPFLVKNIVSPYSIVEISSETGRHIQSAVSSNSYESSLYDSMKETLVILYGLMKEDMSKAISDEIELLQKEEYDCDTLDSVCWTVGSITKAASDDENSELMGTIIPILVSIIESDNPSNDPTFEQIQLTASQDLLFLCSQEAKYFRANPEFLSSLVQIILRFVTEDSSVLNIVAIHSLSLLSKSCKRTFITPIQPSNGTILEDILKVFTDTISNIRPDNLYSFVSIVADIVRFAQSASKEESFTPVFDSFFDQVSTIFNQSCSQIDEDLKRFQFLNQGADAGIKNFPKSDDLTLSIDYSFQQPELASIENIKSVINSICILIAIPTSMNALFLPFFELIWPKLMNIYDFATNNSNMISTTDFDEKYDQSVSKLAQSSFELYNELSNLIATLFANTLKISNNNQPQFIQVIISSFYLGLSYHSLNPQSYPPNILALYGSLFRYAFNFDISEQQTYQAMVKMFQEVYEKIFLPTAEVIKDEFDTFYELRVEILKFIRGVIRGRPDLIFELTEEQIDIFIRMLMWLTKHPYEHISISATETCYMLINSFKSSSRIKDKAIVETFWAQFYMIFVSQMLELLSDSTYKFGFDTQTIVLSSLFNLPIAYEQIDPIHSQFAQVFDKESTVDFVRDLLAKSTSLVEFRSTMKDLLISTKHYSEKDPDLCKLEIFQKKRMDELEKSRAFGETEKNKLTISPEQVEEEVSVISNIFSDMTL